MKELDKKPNKAVFHANAASPDRNYFIQWTPQGLYSREAPTSPGGEFGIRRIRGEQERPATLKNFIADLNFLDVAEFLAKGVLTDAESFVTIPPSWESVKNLDISELYPKTVILPTIDEETVPVEKTATEVMMNFIKEQHCKSRDFASKERQPHITVMSSNESKEMPIIFKRLKPHPSQKSDIGDKGIFSDEMKRIAQVGRELVVIPRHTYYPTPFPSIGRIDIVSLNLPEQSGISQPEMENTMCDCVRTAIDSLQAAQTVDDAGVKLEPIVFANEQISSAIKESEKLQAEEKKREIAEIADFLKGKYKERQDAQVNKLRALRQQADSVLTVIKKTESIFQKLAASAGVEGAEQLTQDEIMFLINQLGH